MKSVILLIIALIVATGSLWAQGPGETRDEFGLGLMLGEPSGVNAQFFWGPRSAIDFTAAWSLGNYFATMADFQIYDYILDSPREWRWFYGGGAYLELPEDEDGTLGVRIPLGIKYQIPHSYVDLWLEAAPALQLIPETEPEFQGGIGVTFWLK